MRLGKDAVREDEGGGREGKGRQMVGEERGREVEEGEGRGVWEEKDESVNV